MARCDVRFSANGRLIYLLQKKPTMRVVKPYYSVQAFLKPRLSVTLVLSLPLSAMKLNTLMGNHNVGVYVVKMDKHFSLQQFMKFVD